MLAVQALGAAWCSSLKLGRGVLPEVIRALWCHTHVISETEWEVVVALLTTAQQKSMHCCRVEELFPMQGSM